MVSPPCPPACFLFSCLLAFEHCPPAPHSGRAIRQPQAEVKVPHPWDIALFYTFTFVGEGAEGGATGEVREGVGMTGAARGV